MADKTILFVCTGNTCRSYMAQAIAENYLVERGDQGYGVKILSAGTGALNGQPPSPHALTVLAEMGLPARQHRSTLLTSGLIREADLILAMTKSHKDSVLQIDPQARDKVFLLKEYPPRRDEQSSFTDTSDIIDPFGLPVEFYRTCAEQLRDHVVKALQAYLAGLDGPEPEEKHASEEEKKGK